MAGRFAVNFDPVITNICVHVPAVHVGDNQFGLLDGHVAINTVSRDRRAQLRIHPALVGFMACEATI